MASAAIIDNPNVPHGRARKLRLGERVTAHGADFGELADIVVDPVTSTVTHCVVEPHHHHLQARLVPIDLIVDDGTGGFDIALDVDDVRGLPRASFSEFVPLATPIDVGDEWDLVGQTVTAHPYWGGDVLGMGQAWDGLAEVSFDRVPKGECEIKRTSRVRVRDGSAVGHVEGLVVAGEHVSGVVVRTGPFGLRHLVTLPLGAVRSVSGDSIELSIDRQAFDTLPSADDLFAPDGDASIPSPLEAQLATIVHHSARSLRGLTSRLRRTSPGKNTPERNPS